jgi:hypothetical protein
MNWLAAQRLNCLAAFRQRGDALQQRGRAIKTLVRDDSPSYK